ncbi:hypothetical protein [Aeromicrobium sp. 179-A 4D2 NHS]|uniref:hypothetical protein n=1 Tax=Aeromicrobium sp. 179-A 4D2 NHS TaxID=3142375 RepID=UPI0039A1A089
MNVGNIAGHAATGLLVFFAMVVAPQLSGWGATTAALVMLAAVAVALTGAVVLARLVPAPLPARQLEYDAAWDHALADLAGDAA